MDHSDAYRLDAHRQLLPLSYPTSSHMGNVGKELNFFLLLSNLESYELRRITLLAGSFR